MPQKGGRDWGLNPASRNIGGVGRIYRRCGGGE